MKYLKKRFISSLSCLLLLTAVSTASAGHVITVDGNLSDWGVTLGGGNGDTLQFGGLNVSAPNPRVGSGIGHISDFHFHYHIEDYDDSSPTNTFLGPHSGGQNYDSEFLGVGINNGHLVIAISTGQRTDNGYQSGKHLYSPGDIRLETSGGVFGLEVGGIDHDNDGQIVAGDVGAFFTLNSGGFTLSQTATNDKTAGSLWKDADWKLSPTTPNTPTQFQMNGGGTRVDDGTYGNILYNYSFPSGSQHAFIEVAIPIGYFGDLTLNSVRWAPACNNDFVETSNLNMHMPEPTSIAMMLIGGVGLLGYRRRYGRK